MVELAHRKNLVCKIIKPLPELGLSGDEYTVEYKGSKEEFFSSGMAFEDLQDYTSDKTNSHRTTAHFKVKKCNLVWPKVHE